MILTFFVNHMSFHFRADKFPISSPSARYPKTEFIVVNLAANFLWFLRIFSPAAWILAFLQQEQNGRYYTHPNATEIYQITVTIISVLFFSVFRGTFVSSIWILIPCVVLIVEAIQYQFWNVILRPTLHPGYKIYSASRTLLILLLQYVQVMFLYALIYLSAFPSDFTGITPLTHFSAIEFSVITMTTVGFGSIAPKPGEWVGLTASTQALVGVFMLGLAIAAAFSRMREVTEVEASKAKE